MFKLMIVDDEPLIRNGLRHMIATENKLFTEIEAASDGVEALQLLGNFQPDLLITDIQMPEMNGLELIIEAQKKKIKRFVILSGYDEFEYAQQAIRLNVSDYLLKPIHQKQLSELLSKTASEITEERKKIISSRHPKQLEDFHENESIRKFMLFVKKNYMRDVSLNEVADHLELHPNYVCNLLKHEIGTTFVNYLQKTRIEHAKEIIEDEYDLPLKVISKKVGYENSRHFYKIFKQHVGQTPGNYRTETLERKVNTDVQ